MHRAPEHEIQYDPEYLTDGGVFDNLGFEKCLQLQGSAPSTSTTF